MAPISLDPNADTVVCVIQTGPVKRKETDFKVLAAALAASPYWKLFIRHMNGVSGFKPNKEHIEDTGITVVAVEIVLRGLHQDYHQRESTRTFASSTEAQVKNTESVTTSQASSVENGNVGVDAVSLVDQPPANISATGQANKPLPEKGGVSHSFGVEVYFPTELSKADIDDVWGVLALVNLNSDGKEHKGKVDVDWTVVQPWFLKWRETSFSTFNTQADFEKVLFPTFAFNDSDGFVHAAKWLCQNTIGNIKEYSPFVFTQKTQWYLHLHLPRHVISWVRIARRKLRTEVSNEIWAIVRGESGWISAARCDCWVVAQYNYLEGLGKAGVLCPELDREKTVMELVQQMKTAKYKEPLNPCVKCSTASINSQLRLAVQVAVACNVVSKDNVPMPSSGAQKMLRKKPQEQLPGRSNPDARN